MVRIIGRRLREVQERLRELGSQRAERRIAHVLLRLAEQAAQGETDGPAIAFPLTRKDIANMCGATLHTASRVLTAWGRVGMIESSRERIVVRDLAAIRHIAGDRR